MTLVLVIPQIETSVVFTFSLRLHSVPPGVTRIGLLQKKLKQGVTEENPGAFKFVTLLLEILEKSCFQIRYLQNLVAHLGNSKVENSFN